MLNLSVSKTIKIRAEFTAEQWQLYTESMPCDSAAAALNAALEGAVGLGRSRNEVRDVVYAEMHRQEKMGALDTEPRGFLEDILDEIFGKEEE